MEEQTIKNLPVGVQNFESLIKDNYLYVDKTSQIWRLTHTGRHYFLARPRRFGKSLLLSTIEAYFQGKKDLFSGLHIYEEEKEWVQHPIFHIDLSPENYSSVDVLTARLDWHLSQWESIYLKDPEKHPQSLSARFENCIMHATADGNRVVILVDEYDKPILSTIGDVDLQNEMRAILKAFYGVLKSQDGNIRFSLLTGVTKFSKISIFSDLNNLNDISRDRHYFDICGLSQSEMDSAMRPYIESFAAANGKSPEEVYTTFLRMYDGYRFTATAAENIFNPFSVLTALSKNEYGYYWFETGTPNFIVELLKRNNYILSDLTEKPIDSTSLDSKDDNGQSIVPLLFQSGYLTIKNYQAENDLYYMDFPNEEVQSGFFRYILPYYTSIRREESAFAIGQFVEEVRSGKAEEFLIRLQAFFADFQYDAQTTPEAHFRNVLFILCKLLGFHVDVEYMTSDGRIDMLLRTVDYVYIIECKLDSTAEVALQQIEDKQYELPWAVDDREKIKIGINFSSESRRPNDWLVQRATQDVLQDVLQDVPQGELQEIIRLIYHNPKITRAEIGDKLQVSEKTIGRKLEKIQDKVRYEGSGYSGHWEIIKKRK